MFTFYCYATTSSQVELKNTQYINYLTGLRLESLELRMTVVESHLKKMIQSWSSNPHALVPSSSAYQTDGSSMDPIPPSNVYLTGPVPSSSGSQMEPVPPTSVYPMRSFHPPSLYPTESTPPSSIYPITPVPSSSFYQTSVYPVEPSSSLYPTPPSSFYQVEHSSSFYPTEPAAPPAPSFYPVRPVSLSNPMEQASPSNMYPIMRASSFCQTELMPPSSMHPVRPIPPYSMRPAPPYLTQVTQSSLSTTAQSSSSQLISVDCNGTVAHLIPVTCTGTNYLPSSAIVRSSLKPVAQVIRETQKLLKEGKIGTVAQALAQEAFFGKEVMAQCTPSGTPQLKGLPQDELNQLKVTMFKLLPIHHSCPLQFESDWAKCVTSVEQACKRERNKM